MLEVEGLGGRTNSSIVLADLAVGSGERPSTSAVKTRSMRFHRRMAGIDNAVASSCSSATRCNHGKRKAYRQGMPDSWEGIRDDMQDVHAAMQKLLSARCKFGKGLSSPGHGHLRSCPCPSAAKGTSLPLPLRPPPTPLGADDDRQMP